MVNLSNSSCHLALSDTNALKVYYFDLPEGSKLTGDKPYTDYVIEDVINEPGIAFSPLQKKNSSRPAVGALFDVILSKNG